MLSQQVSDWETATDSLTDTEYVPCTEYSDLDFDDDDLHVIGPVTGELDPDNPTEQERTEDATNTEDAGPTDPSTDTTAPQNHNEDVEPNIDVEDWDDLPIPQTRPKRNRKKNKVASRRKLRTAAVQMDGGLSSYLTYLATVVSPLSTPAGVAKGRISTAVPHISTSLDVADGGKLEGQKGGSEDHSMTLLDPEVVEQAIQEPGTTTVQEAQVRNATPTDYEQWKAAAENELHSSFYGMYAVTEATKEEISSAGAILPMKCVWTVKAGGVKKCRGVVCGNFQKSQHANKCGQPRRRPPVSWPP